MTSSIRPIFMPERARARRADWAPGPGVLVALPVFSTSAVCGAESERLQKQPRGYHNVPPVARILMCRAVMPSSLQRVATSWAANMAA